MGEPTEAPMLAPARDPPQMMFDFIHPECTPIYREDIDLLIVPEANYEDPFPKEVDPPFIDEGCVTFEDEVNPVFIDEPQGDFIDDVYVEPEYDYDQTVSW